MSTAGAVPERQTRYIQGCPDRLGIARGSSSSENTLLLANGGTVEPSGDLYRRALPTKRAARCCTEHVSHGSSKAPWRIGVVIVDVGQGAGLFKLGPIEEEMGVGTVHVKRRRGGDRRPLGETRRASTLRPSLDGRLQTCRHAFGPISGRQSKQVIGTTRSHWPASFKARLARDVGGSSGHRLAGRRCVITEQRTVRETQAFSGIGPGGGRAIGDALTKKYMLTTSSAETASS